MYQKARRLQSWTRALEAGCLDIDGKVIGASNMAASRILSIDWSSKTKGETQLFHHHALRLAVVCLLYLGAGKLGLAIPFTSSKVSPVWPAAGVAVAAVLIYGSWIAPAIALAAFVVNFFSPIPTLAAIGIGAGNATSGIVAGLVLRRFSDFQISLSRLKDVWRFVIVGAVLSTTVAASAGVTSLTIAHLKAWSGFGSAWRVWWLGDAMGVLVIGPLLLAGRDLVSRWRGWRALEFFAVAMMVVGTSTRHCPFRASQGYRDQGVELNSYDGSRPHQRYLSS